MPENTEARLRKEILKLRTQLENERKEFRSILHSIVDGVYTTDINRNVTFWNKGAERITGFEADTVIGDSCKNLLGHTDDSGNSLCESACPLSETMNSSNPIYGKNVHSGTAWGVTVPVSVSCAPIIDSEGNIVGAVEVFRDISDQKKLEKQKSDFYSMITHDIKSPLTTIVGYCELIKEPDISLSSEDLIEFTTHIHRSANRIKWLVDDFLNISKMSTGASELHCEPVSVEKLLNKITDEHGPAAESKGVSLSVSTEPGLPVVNADPNMLERAVINLVGNAVKYTPGQGTVSVSARLAQDHCGPGRCTANEIEITVTDTGPGIPEEDLERVFDMYYRAGNSFGIEGTGLGLAIVKAVCESHGGSVTLASSPGEGSTFTIHLPVAKDEGI